MEKKSVIGLPFTVLEKGGISSGSLTTEIAGQQSNIKVPQTNSELLRDLKQPSKTDGSLNVSIKRYFTDASGLVLDKTTIAAGYKTKYPVFFWGKSDFDGAFKYALQVTPPQPGIVFLYKFIAGESFDWYSFQGGDIGSKYSEGDLVIVYADSKTAPTLLIYIVVSMLDKSYATVLKESVKGNVFVNKFLYVTDNANNYNESIGIYTINNIGIYKSDFFQPFIYKMPYYQQTDFLTIPINFKLSSKIGVATYFQYNTELMNFEFKVKF